MSGVNISRVGRPPIPLEFRFWTKVLPVDSGCWEWQGALAKEGYGRFTVAGSTSSEAHRVSYERFVGPIPPEMFVLHRCDNRPCVRPDHLFVGSHTDNMQDMVAKGRERNVLAARNSAKTHCKRGHEFTPENTLHQNGKAHNRTCRACNTIRYRAWSLRNEHR